MKGKKSRVIHVLEKVKPKLASRALMNMTPIKKSQKKKKKPCINYFIYYCN